MGARWRAALGAWKATRGVGDRPPSRSGGGSCPPLGSSAGGCPPPGSGGGGEEHIGGDGRSPTAASTRRAMFFFVIFFWIFIFSADDISTHTRKSDFLFRVRPPHAKVAIFIDLLLHVGCPTDAKTFFASSAKMIF